jgi:hypothetical protein
MFIKHLIGARAGEIEDVQFEGARAKVLAGQAEDVYNTLGLKKTISPAVVAPTVESNRVDEMKVEAKRKRGR